MTNKNDESTYETKLTRLDAIVTRLDSGNTPIDQLALDVNEGTALILELHAKLREVETSVGDAFRLLEEAQNKDGAAAAR
jgi:exodeoxyribonuclease VII small subunit